MLKTESMVKYPVIFLKPTTIQYTLMVVIFTVPLQAWSWKKNVPVHMNIMG